MLQLRFRKDEGAAAHTSLHPAPPPELASHPLFSGAHSVGLVTAEAPRFPVTNAGGNEALEKHLRRLGLQHELTHGSYGGPENSYVVHGATREQMHELGHTFGQEAVVHSEGGKHELLYTHGPNNGQYHPSHPGVHYYGPEKPDDYYTLLPGHGYFSLPFDFSQLLKSPSTYQPQIGRPELAPAAVAKEELGAIRRKLRSVGHGILWTPEEYQTELAASPYGGLGKAEQSFVPLSAPVPSVTPRTTSLLGRSCDPIVSASPSILPIPEFLVADKTSYNPREVCSVLAKTINEKVAAYAADFAQLRKRELRQVGKRLAKADLNMCPTCGNPDSPDSCTCLGTLAKSNMPGTPGLQPKGGDGQIKSVDMTSKCVGCGKPHPIGKCMGKGEQTPGDRAAVAVANKEMGGFKSIASNPTKLPVGGVPENTRKVERPTVALTPLDRRMPKPKPSTSKNPPTRPVDENKATASDRPAFGKDEIRDTSDKMKDLFGGKEPKVLHPSDKKKGKPVTKDQMAAGRKSPPPTPPGRKPPPPPAHTETVGAVREMRALGNVRSTHPEVNRALDEVSKLRRPVAKEQMHSSGPQSTLGQTAKKEKSANKVPGAKLPPDKGGKVVAAPGSGGAVKKGKKLAKAGFSVANMISKPGSVRPGLPGMVPHYEGANAPAPHAETTQALDDVRSMRPAHPETAQAMKDVRALRPPDPTSVGQANAEIGGFKSIASNPTAIPGGRLVGTGGRPPAPAARQFGSARLDQQASPAKSGSARAGQTLAADKKAAGVGFVNSLMTRLRGVGNKTWGALTGAGGPKPGLGRTASAAAALARSEPDLNKAWRAGGPRPGPAVPPGPGEEPPYVASPTKPEPDYYGGRTHGELVAGYNKGVAEGKIGNPKSVSAAMRAARDLGNCALCGDNEHPGACPSASPGHDLGDCALCGMGEHPGDCSGGYEDGGPGGDDETL